MWSLGEEFWAVRINTVDQIWLRCPYAFGLEDVKRPVFPNKLSKWKVFFSAEFEIAITFLSLSGSRYSAEILLLGPGTGLVNFPLLWEEGPWLLSDSHRVRLPQGSRTIDIEVVVAQIIVEEFTEIQTRKAFLFRKPRLRVGYCFIRNAQ